MGSEPKTDIITVSVLRERMYSLLKCYLALLRSCTQLVLIDTNPLLFSLFYSVLLYFLFFLLNLSVPFSCPSVFSDVSSYLQISNNLCDLIHKKSTFFHTFLYYNYVEFSVMISQMVLTKFQ